MMTLLSLKMFCKNYSDNRSNIPPKQLNSQFYANINQYLDSEDIYMVEPSTLFDKYYTSIKQSIFEK